jgi:Zn finger protein HypA/HybF involved in hydrogenase expression
VEWAANFEGLKGSPGSWERVEPPLLHNFAIANRSLKTPKRLQLGELQSVDVETLPMARKCLEHFSMLEGCELGKEGEYLQAKIKSGLKMFFAMWSRLEATFNIIHLKFKILQVESTSTGKPYRKPCGICKSVFSRRML